LAFQTCQPIILAGSGDDIFDGFAEPCCCLLTCGQRQTWPARRDRGTFRCRQPCGGAHHNVDTVASGRPVRQRGTQFGDRRTRTGAFTQPFRMQQRRLRSLRDNVLREWRSVSSSQFVEPANDLDFSRIEQPTGNPDRDELSAADVTADVFRIAIERYESFDSGRGHQRAWLLGIAANLIRGHWRTEERRLRAFAREGGAAVPPIDPLLRIEEAVDADAELARVMLAVAALSPEDRDLLTLFAWEECGYAEIAEALDIPVGTVRSRLHRIRHSLAMPPVREPNR